MEGAFRLLVYAIAAIALLWLFFVFIAPMFFPAGDALKDVEAGLRGAESSPGRYVADDVAFERGTVLNGPSFDTQTRSVTFACNKAGICCDLTPECEQDPYGCTDAQLGCRIAYGPRRAVALVRDKVRASFRCGLESGIFNCRVYFGEEPAQLEMEVVGFSESVDLGRGFPEIMLSIKNTGGSEAFDITSTVNVYRRFLEGGREAKEFYLGPLSSYAESLAPGDETEAVFVLAITDSGDYTVDVRSSAEDAGFDSAEINFEAHGGAVTTSCRTDYSGDAFLREDECQKKYFCTGCGFAYECKLKWSEQVSAELELADPGFAYGKSPMLEGQCELPVECEATTQAETTRVSGGCKTKLNCLNCSDANGCRNAWEARLISEGSQGLVFDLESAAVSYAYVNQELEKCSAPSGAVVTGTEAGFCSYAGSITPENNPSRFERCSENLELLEKYLESSGLKERGFDLLMLESIISTESSCHADPDRANCQGLMQVRACGSGSAGNCISKCTVEENIEKGTAHLRRDYDSVASKGITGMDAIRLMLFGYNRGLGTQNKAIEIYNQQPEKGLYEAMRDACYYYYDKGSYGNCSGFGREDCCTKMGLGARYPDRVIAYYTEACKEAGGSIGGIGAERPKGKVIALDPGHGANSKAIGGCSSVRTYKLDGWTESDYALYFAERAKAILEARGYTVLLTRASGNENPTCSQRTAVANSGNADVFVSLHLNAGGASANGAESLVCMESSCRGGSARASKSIALGKSIEKSLVALGFRGRGIRSDTKSAPGRLGVLRQTTMPAALVEIAFITGNSDSLKLKDPAFRERIAGAIADGIDEYMSG